MSPLCHTAIAYGRGTPWNALFVTPLCNYPQRCAPFTSWRTIKIPQPVLLFFIFACFSPITCQHSCGKGEEKKSAEGLRSFHLPPKLFSVAPQQQEELPTAVPA